MAAIPDSAVHLLEGKDFAHLATINADGTPQVTPVWVGRDGDLVTVNTTEGLVKTENLRRDPNVAVSIIAQANPYESLVIQGEVVEMVRDGADEEMDERARRYLDVDSFPFRQPGEVRVLVKIKPEKVLYRAGT